MNNRITQLFQRKNKILSLFTTAGYPNLNDTINTCQALENAGVDMIEIGFPFSDPVADGPTIQQTNLQALKNGMNLVTLFQQLEQLRNKITIPVILMGYLNPVLQFGLENFCQKCSQVGIDGVILPDLPFEEYCDQYHFLFEQHSLSKIFLITQRTNEQRIREIDQISKGFLYVVSTEATTGISLDLEQTHQEYFLRLNQMNLKNPLIVGFGIHNKATFDQVTQHTNGGIIASAYLRQLSPSKSISEATQQFIQQIRGGA